MSATDARPAHAHDCNCCGYLGTAILHGKTFDFWVCNAQFTQQDNLVCRWSSNGEDCFTAPVKVARLVCRNDAVYKYAMSLYDQWNAYRDDMGYNDIYW